MFQSKNWSFIGGDIAFLVIHWSFGVATKVSRYFYSPYIPYFKGKRMMPQNTTPTTHQNNLPPLDDDLKYLIDTIFNTPASPGELYNEMHLFLIHNKISSIAQLHAIGEHERKLWTYPVVQGYDSDGKSLPPLLKTLSSYHLGLFKTYEGYVLYRDMELDDQVDVYDFQNSVSRDEFIRYAASAHLIFFVNNQLPWQTVNQPINPPPPSVTTSSDLNMKIDDDDDDVVMGSNIIDTSQLPDTSSTDIQHVHSTDTSLPGTIDSDSLHHCTSPTLIRFCWNRISTMIHLIHLAFV